MQPDFTDSYVHGNVELRVLHWSEGKIDKQYWLKVGICSLQLKQEEFDGLLEIMDAYYDENVEEE